MRLTDAGSYSPTKSSWPRKRPDFVGLSTHAEVGGHDRDLEAVEGPGRRGDVDGREADLAPLGLEEIRAVLGAPHPHLESALRVDVGRRPEQVLAHRPVAPPVRAVEALHAAPEGRAVRRVMAEVADARHLVGLLPRRRGEIGREPERSKAVSAAQLVDV